MKLHLLAALVIGILAFFIGIFVSAAMVHEAVFEAFDYYITTHSNGPDKI